MKAEAMELKAQNRIIRIIQQASPPSHRQLAYDFPSSDPHVVDDRTMARLSRGSAYRYRVSLTMRASAYTPSPSCPLMATRSSMASVMTISCVSPRRSSLPSMSLPHSFVSLHAI